MAILILYIWVLGFDLYCFERYKISHRLTFRFNDHHYSTSAQIMRLAGIFTAIYLGVFLIYLLCISKVFILNGLFRSHHLILLVYAPVLVYMFCPFPIFNYVGRMYTLRIFTRALASPCMGVDFTIVWMTDQWQSLITPLRDISYTVCYYVRMDFSQLDGDNPCSEASTFEVALLVVLIAISYRIVQCMRLGYDQGYWCKPHMFNTIKYLLSLASAILAFHSNDDPDLLHAWITISIISTMYSYFWDIKMDWNLL
jgi:hypothetical protein